MSLKKLEELLGVKKVEDTTARSIVVVVDDDASIRASLQSVLCDEYDVRLCRGAVEAIKQVDNETDCVILDVKMPTHDGFWVAEQLRSCNQDVPIIFHSAYQDAKNPLEIINEFRPFGYVVKGEALHRILTLVGQAVRYSARNRARRKAISELRDVRADMSTLGRRKVDPG